MGYRSCINGDFFFDMAGSSVVWYSPRGDPLRKVEGYICGAVTATEWERCTHIYISDWMNWFDIYVELRIRITASHSTLASWCLRAIYDQGEIGLKILQGERNLHNATSVFSHLAFYLFYFQHLTAGGRGGEGGVGVYGFQYIVTSRYHLCRSTDYFPFLPTCTISYVCRIVSCVWGRGELEPPPLEIVFGWPGQICGSDLYLSFLSPAYVQGPRIFIFIYIYRDRNSHHVHTLDLNLGWIPHVSLRSVVLPLTHRYRENYSPTSVTKERPSTCIRE